MYADDLALVAGSPEELQAILDVVHNYAQKWRYNLNAGVVMVLGETRSQPALLGSGHLVMRCRGR